LNQSGQGGVKVKGNQQMGDNEKRYEEANLVDQPNDLVIFFLSVSFSAQFV
jgi:hypothetical protein